MSGRGLAEIVWITHRVKEARLQAALSALRRLDVVSEVSNVIRVEG